MLIIYNLITALKAVIYQAEGFESPTRELVQSVLNEPWKLEIIMDVAREMDFLPEGDIPTTSKGEENDPDD